MAPTRRIAVALWIVSIFAALPLVAADQAAQANEVGGLLKGLQKPDQLARYKDLIIPREGELVITKKGKEFELKNAREAIERAKVIIPKLRKAIKPGTSVFDYPGLLAHGSIYYDEDGGKYECYVGVYLDRDEGVAPYDFRFIFDEKGRIITVQDVVYTE
jgi:hypothetical protein